MKKTFLGLVLISITTVGLWGCSQDDEVKSNQTTENTQTNSIKSTNSNTPTIEDEDDRLFFNYVSSTEFAAYHNSIKNFSDNIGTSKTINDFKSDNEMFSWIENNIHATKFTNVSTARRDWDEVGALLINLDTKFPEIESFYKVKAKYTVLIKIDKWIPWGLGLDFTTTLGTCADNLKSCRQSASDNYAQDAYEVCELKENGEVFDAIRKQNLALSTYKAAIQGCISEYHDCNGTN